MVACKDFRLHCRERGNLAARDKGFDCPRAARWCAPGMACILRESAAADWTNGAAASFFLGLTALVSLTDHRCYRLPQEIASQQYPRTRYSAGYQSFTAERMCNITPRGSCDEQERFGREKFDSLGTVC